MILPIMALVLLHFYVTISKNFQISVFLRGGGGVCPPCPHPNLTFGCPAIALRGVILTLHNNLYPLYYLLLQF